MYKIRAIVWVIAIFLCLSASGMMKNKNPLKLFKSSVKYMSTNEKGIFIKKITIPSFWCPLVSVGLFCYVMGRNDRIRTLEKENEVLKNEIMSSKNAKAWRNFLDNDRGGPG